MLVIIDDYDIRKLLCDFGFTTCITPNQILYVRDMMNHSPDDRIRVAIDRDTRLIMIEYKLKYGGESYTWSLDVIYDLIQAGLVRHVKE